MCMDGLLAAAWDSAHQAVAERHYLQCVILIESSPFDVGCVSGTSMRA